MPEFSTPMMRQYHEIRTKYPDCLLFYRMGDFYELFNEDAHIGAAVLNITLTGKAGGKDGRIPMAGVPYHAVDSYIAKLVKAGYKVAICEQLSPPNKKGLVERDVVRIVTPGTLLDENNLDKKANNYIVSVLVDEPKVAFSIADLSTGYFATTEQEIETLEKTLLEELARLQPSECILPDALYNDADLLKLLKGIRGMNIYPFADFVSFATDAPKYLARHFGVKTLEGFGLTNCDYALQSASALLGYLKETQKGNVGHIKKLTKFGRDDGLTLDRSTMINLELFSTIREHDTRGSLLSVMDQTITAMGGRLLKQWIKKPLADKNEIEKRLDAVETLSSTSEIREVLKTQLQQIPDIERLLSRLSVNLGNARDLVNLRLALKIISETKQLLNHLSEEVSPRPLHKLRGDSSETNNSLLDYQAQLISKDLEKVISLIETTIVD